jgi:hypothetical protein
MTTRERAVAIAMTLAPLSLVWATDEAPPQRSSPPFYAGIGGVTNPVLKLRTSPVYPKKLRGKRLEGQIILQVVVKSDGTTGSIEVIRCRVNKEHEEPDKSLDNLCEFFVAEATIAVAKWVYEPAHYRDEPVDVYWTVVVDFRMNQSRERAEHRDGERSNYPLHLPAGRNCGVES